MSLESRIVELTAVITTLAEAIINNQSAPAEKKPAKVNKAAPVITDQATVRLLAKEKVAAGAGKADIKKMISALGGESINDLDEDNLLKFKDQLEAL